MKQEPSLVRPPANAARIIPFAVTACFRSLVIALLAFGLSQSAYSTVALESYWPLGEGAAIGTDAASGTANPFNNTAGTTLQTATPAVAGSTAYARTSGVNFQGIWMFGAGSTPQTVPADDWGVQFNVRIPTLPTSSYKAVFGMSEGATNGLVIEAAYVSGTVYFDVNQQGLSNYIITRTPATAVTANTWYNLALVKSGGTITFYVNGTAVGTNATPINTSGLLGLGFEQNVGTHQLAGDFDEARFFTFAPGAFTTADLNRSTVAYDGNSGVGTAPVDNGYYYSGTPVTVLGAGSLTKSGSVFTGWNTLADGTGTSYSPAATFNIGGANTTLYAQWAAATATITAPATFSSAVSTIYGTDSASESVAISGVSLTGDITATAPANLEVSNDGVTFGSTATFTQSGGTVFATLYVRIKSNAPVSGSPYDNQLIVLTSAGATPVNVATAVSGNTVTAKNLTVPSATAQSKMYDGTTAGIVIGTLQAAEAFGAGSSGDGIPYIGDTLTVSAPGTFSSSAVGGPYTVTHGTFTLGGVSAGNYTLTQPSFGSLTASILSTATWTELAGGSWTDTANWQDNVVGTGADNTADFSTLDLIAPTTVTLASPQTIGGLIFGDNTTPDNNWIVSGSTLTLAATTPPVINVIDQTTTISSALASANGMVKIGTGTLALSSVASGAMNLTVNDGTLDLAVPFGGLAYNNAGGLANGGTLTVNSGATLQISGRYNIGYNQAVDINGGTLNLANNFTGDGQNYTLNLNFTNGGSIISSTGSSLRWGELGDATITVNGTVPATINCDLWTISTDSKQGTINVMDPAGVLDFNGAIKPHTYVPASGPVPLTKTGPGTLNLNGGNTYTGATTVSGGTLAVTGSLGATDVTVQTTATLGGNGNIGGAVTIDSGAHHALAVEATTGAQITRTITGALTLTAGNILDLTAAAPPAAGVYVLVTATGGITGTPTTVNLTGVTGTVAVNGNNLELTVGGVADYSSWASTNSTAGTIDLDHDNDGVSNGVEYFLGGPSGNTTGFTALPGVTTVAGVRSVTWTKAATYTGAYATDFVVETSTTLAAGSWTTETLGVNVAIVGDNVTYTFPAGPVKTFARLKVTGP